jgi:hypothetical protein
VTVKQETPLYRLEKLLKDRPNEVTWRFIMREDPFGYGWSPALDQACAELKGLYTKLNYDYHPPFSRLSQQLMARVKSSPPIGNADFLAGRLISSVSGGRVQLEGFGSLGKALYDLQVFMTDQAILWPKDLRMKIQEDFNTIAAALGTGQLEFPDLLEQLEKDVNWACECVHADFEDKKRALDSLVSGLMRDRLAVGLSPLPEWGLFDRFILTADLGFFKTTVVEEAKRYLDAGWMHTPWLTNFVLVTLLDSDLAPLARLTRLVDPVALAEGLWRWMFWQKMLPWLQPLVYSGLTAAAIAGLFIFGLPWVTPLVVGLLGWYYSNLFKWRIRFRRARRKLLQPAAALLQIRNEIASGLYNVSETLRRLRELEPQGVYVHSFAYSLLKLG